MPSVEAQPQWWGRPSAGDWGQEPRVGRTPLSMPPIGPCPRGSSGEGLCYLSFWVLREEEARENDSKDVRPRGSVLTSQQKSIQPAQPSRSVGADAPAPIQSYALAFLLVWLCGLQCPSRNLPEGGARATLVAPPPISGFFCVCFCGLCPPRWLGLEGALSSGQPRVGCAQSHLLTLVASVLCLR